MKFDCGPSPEERARRRREKQLERRRYLRSLKNWHRWYAWYPVRVGPNDCRWLEYVERSLEFNFWSWGEPTGDVKAYYREIGKT